MISKKAGRKGVKDASSKDMPLEPRPVASKECLVERVPEMEERLRKCKRLSDAAIYGGIDITLKRAEKKLERGEAAAMSPEHRVRWLWETVWKETCKAQGNELPCVPLNYEGADPRTSHTIKGKKCNYVIPKTQDENDASEAVPEGLREKLEALRPRRRQAVTLCVLEGRSLSEAGKEMEIDAETVRYHRNKGVEELRKRLGVR